MTQPLLTIENLHTELDTEQGVLRAISGLSVALARGETFALVGESGCGKSMTAQTILRLLPDNAGVSQGHLWLAPRTTSAPVVVKETEQDLLDLPESAMRRLRGARIGMIFQEPNTSLNPVMTVGAQVLESLYQHTPLRGEAAQQKAIDWLTQVGLPNPAEKMAAYPFQLSGGQRQRVMIAIALAGEPDLLIADEPTTALDVTTQAQILQLLEKLQRERGMAMLLITHDLGIVAQMAHQVALMYAGEIVEIAERDAFFAHPKHPYAQALFAALPNLARRQHALAAIPGSVPALTQTFKGCRFANRCPQVRPLCHTRVPQLLGDQVGEPSHTHAHSHAVRCFLHDPNTSLTPLTLPASRKPDTTQLKPNHQVGDQALLALQNVSVIYPPAGNALVGLPFRRTQKPVAHRAVKNVSLTLYPGQTLALVGESGCGKTTVAKAVLRLLDGRAKIEGQILLNGQSIQARDGETTLRRAVQIVFQDPFSSLNPRMRIGEILREGLQAIRPDWNAAQRALRIQTLLKQVGLPNDAFDRYPHEFSGGQRQRIAIARALAAEPQLIICDEPTSALDVSVQAQVLNLLKELQQTLGVAYLFITHNLSVVEYLADEVAVMQAGEIVEQGPAEQVLRQPQQAYTQQLLAAIPPLPNREINPTETD